MRQHTSAGVACLFHVIVVLGLVTLFQATATADDRPSQRRDDLVAVVERVKGAVVNIHSERINNANDDPLRVATMQPQRVNGMGTGIVLDPRGYIVTNYHVVDDVQSLRVRLCDGTSCIARVIALDKESDLAVIKIDPPKPLPLVSLGTANDLMLAERVIAIGNAYGYEHTVTLGHVSAMKRDVTLNKEVSYKSLIQTQTPINPGNSGGPLFNKLGEVVGVNVAIRAGAQNIAFAIPVDTMIAKAAEMMSIKRRSGLRHGIVALDKHERDAEDSPIRRTVTVQRIETDSPASVAGMKAGDIIERVGDLPICTSIDLERSFLDRPAKALAVRVRRASESGSAESVELNITVQPVSAIVATATVNSPSLSNDGVFRKLGVKLYPVGKELVTRIDAQLRGGMLIQHVGNGTPAARAGLQQGDILIGLHLWESLNLANVQYVLDHKDLATFSPVRTYYVRDGKIHETVISGIE